MALKPWHNPPKFIPDLYKELGLIYRNHEAIRDLAKKRLTAYLHQYPESNLQSFQQREYAEVKGYTRDLHPEKNKQHKGLFDAFEIYAEAVQKLGFKTFGDLFDEASKYVAKLNPANRDHQYYEVIKSVKAHAHELQFYSYLSLTYHADNAQIHNGTYFTKEYFLDYLQSLEKIESGRKKKFEREKATWQMKSEVPDIDFIQGQRTEAFTPIPRTESHSEPEIFSVTKGTETRSYTATRFLNLILECYYIAADKALAAKNLNEAIIRLIEAETRIKRLIREHDLKERGYDFTELFEDLADQRKLLEKNKELGFAENENKTKIKAKQSKSYKDTHTKHTKATPAAPQNFKDVFAISDWRKYISALEKTEPPLLSNTWEFIGTPKKHKGVICAWIKDLQFEGKIKRTVNRSQLAIVLNKELKNFNLGKDGKTFDNTSKEYDSHFKTQLKNT